MRYGDSAGHYEIDKFPGNAAICVSTHTFVKKELRGGGMGQEQHLERLEIAKDLGYNYIIATVREDNEVEKHILEKNHWTRLDRFWNEETESEIGIWGRKL